MDMNNDRWLVKIRRYDGSVSVVKWGCSQTEANAWVRKLNEDEQSKKYYAEQFNPEHGFLRG